MYFNFRSYDPISMESDLQEAKLREKDPHWDRRSYGKRIAFRVITVIGCLAALYFLSR